MFNLQFYIGRKNKIKKAKNIQAVKSKKKCVLVIIL